MADPDQIQRLNGYIARSERHVASQRAVVARLIDIGADTVLAATILEKFEAGLAEHRRHLGDLEARH